MYMVEDAVLTSSRFTGVECAANHVVAEAYDNAVLMSKAMAFAGSLNKGGHRWGNEEGAEWPGPQTDGRGCESYQTGRNPGLDRTV